MGCLEHYCTLNEDGELVDRTRIRPTPSGVEKWFTNLPRIWIAPHSVWVSEQLQEPGHEVIVANVRELWRSRTATVVSPISSTSS